MEYGKCESKLLRVLLPAVLLAGAVFSETLVSSPVRISGRTGTSSSGNPTLYWGCNSVNARFEGTSLGVRLKSNRTYTYYQVIIDGGEPVRFVSGTTAETTYTIATNLTDTVHDVELYRITEGIWGETEFFGFVLDDGKTLLTPPDAPALKIEFYGDSITTGYGNEAEDGQREEDPAVQNNYMAYSAITARNLDAEISCIAVRGIGIFTGYVNITMPDIWDRVKPSASGALWDFNQWTPDVVVVNLLANDATNPFDFQPYPDEAGIIEYYTNFVGGIRAVYPDAHIVCTLGSMSATAEGSPWPGTIYSAAAQMNDGNMSVCIFPYIGTAYHPRVSHHIEMADQLTAHIRSVLGPSGFIFQMK